MDKHGTLVELDMTRIQLALERERRRRELTCVELAGKLGVSPSTPRQWRRGSNGMNADTALRICFFLRRDLREFVRQVPPADPLPAPQGQAA